MKRSVSKTARVVAVQDQVSCNLGEESVILQLKDGAYYGLNPVGTTVWNLIQTQRSVGEILEHVLAEYDVEATRCEGDLVKLLGELEAAGLIEVSDGGTAP